MGLIEIDSKKLISGTNKFNATSQVYNKDALKNWFMKFHNINGINSRVLFMGDSLIPFSTYFSDRLKETTDGGLGLVSPYVNIYTTNGLATVTYANWTEHVQQTDGGNWGFQGRYIYSSNNAATMDVNIYSSPITNCRVWFEGSIGSFDWKFSGAATTINTDGSGLLYVDFTWEDGETHLYIENIIGTVRIYAFELYNTTGKFIADHLTNGGSQAEDWQGNMSYVKQFVSLKNHELAVIQLGANDAGYVSTANFKTYIETIITDLREANPNIEILIIATNYKGTGGLDDDVFNDQVIEYRDICIDNLETWNVALWDWGALFGLWTISNSWGLIVDEIHPNTSGWNHQTDALYNLFLNLY